MSRQPLWFQAALAVLALGFTTAFAVIVLPPLAASRDLIGAFAGGFVNPYATGYSLDTIFCWLVLAAWVLEERGRRGVRYGWVALLLGVVPGVAVGFAAYLLIRARFRRPPPERSGQRRGPDAGRARQAGS